ncbi:MAG: hypothetical protein V4751_04910 [Pseudomonadota bacterium]
MSTKAKATPKKATPAKALPKAKPAKTTPVVAAPENAIKVLKKGSCPSLSDTGVLEYEVGSDEAKETYFRVVTNNAGGFFSKEWVAWSKIFAACNHCDWLTSIHLRSLFNSKSVNSAGFLLAPLMDQGLVQRSEGKSRHYVLTDKARKAAAPV